MTRRPPRYQNIPIRSGEEPARLSDGVKVSIRSAVYGISEDEASRLDEPAMLADYAALEARILAAALTPLRPGGEE
jgi:hypothetical protein